MKTRLYLGVGIAAALAAVLAVTSQGVRSAIAQETLDRPNVQRDQVDQRQRPQNAEYNRRDTAADRSHRSHGQAMKAQKASDLIGMNVRGASGDDDIGSINDLMIGPNGRVKYAAVSFGGFLGVGDKLFAVPFDSIEFVENDDEWFARIDVTEQKLENMKGFNQDNWPNQANTDFGGGHGRLRADRPATGSDVPR